MPPANEPQNMPPNVQDKRKPAPGVLPKNAQTWVVMGLTSVIVLMLWVSGPAKGAKSSHKPDAPSSETVAGLSPAEIASRLERERREQQTSATSAGRFPNREAGRGEDAAAPSLGNAETASAAEKDPIGQDMRRREYTSRFASSVSLSYRSPQVSGSARSAADPASQQPIDISALEIPNPPGVLAGAGVNPAQSPAVPADRPLKRSNPNFNQASGKGYVIFEGTVLETALVTRLNGDSNGPVICMLTNHVYSHDGQHLLVPAGTKVLGEAKRVEGFGQTRLAVIFHRLVMPDGYSVDLDQFQGLNQIGETGLKDKVNHHYWQIFGASIAVGAIGGLAEAGTSTSSLGLPQTTSDAYRQGVATSLSQSSLHVLDRFLNLLPTVTIREGHRVKVYLTQDLLLPDYAQHEMPSSF
jgi:type IV secretory pathway VirB10-like protein